MLKIEKLTKSYGGVKVVDNCSFEIKKGEITALIGPNGSGKTTLFNLISGVVKPDAGNIFFNNESLVGKSIGQISNLGISRLFQRPSLFKNLTVKENLILAIDNEDTYLWKNIFGLNKGGDKKKLVDNILNELEISNLSQKIIHELSFGQKRLVELARTILNPHELLILDEPVAGVHPKIRKKIASYIKKLKKGGKTILLIEHDMTFTLGIADHVIALDAGKVIAKGKPANIRRNKAVLKAYLGD